MNALISRAMETFGKGMNLSYLPREKEAGIFAKEIGPLAALASSPQFQGFNPQIQKMIADRIGGYLGHGQQGGGQQQESSPGYESDRDIYDQLQQGSTATQGPGAKSKVAKSNIAGALEKVFGENAVSKYLGGSEAAGENAKFEQVQQLAAQKLILKGYPADKANAIVKQMPSESDKAYAARLKPLFVSQQQPQAPEMPQEGGGGEQGGEIDRSGEQKEMQFASKLSSDIKQQLGKDVPENLIFNYLSQHPGKVHIPSLLKAVGAR